LTKRAPGTERAVAWGKAQILLASVLWGTTGTAQALAPGDVQPLAVAALRIGVGGLALVAVAAARRTVRSMRVAPVALGALCLVAAQLAFFASLRRTGVAVGTVVAIGSSPMFAGALDLVLARRRPRRRWVVATVLAIAGCVLLLAVGRSVEVDPVGILLALVVGVGYAGYIFATKDLVATQPPGSVTAAVFGVAAVCMVPVALATDVSWAWKPRGAIVVAHLALLTVAFAYTVFSHGLTVVPAATAVTLTLAEPMTAGTLGVVVLGERLSPIALAGVALVLSGLVLLTLPDGSTGRWPSTRSWSKGRTRRGRSRS
jgi:drug/metabolite transporter, DME family